jgi:uncharacterized membrane protein
MTKSRLEAFSDGVLAVIITIMVLEIKVPKEDGFEALVELGPKFCGYLVSFVYIGIYWNNHHHLMHLAARISGGVMWANLHLLFWLSLVPMCTGWAGEHPSASWPAATYGVTLFMAGVGWLILQRTLIARNGGKDSALAKAIGKDMKGNLSAVLYLSAIGLAFVRAWMAEAIYAVVALIWLVPDRRIEAHLEGPPEP